MELKRRLLIMTIIHILTQDNFTARLKQVNLASKNDIADFVKKKSRFWR